MGTEIITIDDIRKTGHCTRGAKLWFQKYGLDFRDFVQNGIEADVLLATGDQLAQQVVDAKRAKQETDGQV